MGKEQKQQLVYQVLGWKEKSRMYNLLLVDDEEIVTKGLRKFVDWKELGFNVAATVHSVDEAIEALNNHQIHIILTDVKMPEKSGIDLLNIVKEEYTDIKTVILSGYGEFSYAQKAMRLGALGYLTKPVNFMDLKTIFKDIYTMLCEEENRKFQNKEFLKIKRETYLNNIVKGYKDASKEKEVKNLNLSLMNEPYSVIRIKFAMTLSDYQKLDHYLEILNEILKEKLDNQFTYHTFKSDIKELSIIIYHNLENNCLEGVFEEIGEEINRHVSTNLCIGIGNTYKDISQIRNSYVQAGKALQYHVFKRTSTVRYDEIDNNLYIDHVLNEEDRKDILNYLSMSLKEEFLQYLNDKYKHFIKQDVHMNIIYSFSIEIFVIIQKYFSNFQDEEYLNKKIYNAIRELMFQDNKDEIKNYSLKNIQSILEDYEQQEKPTSSIIEIAKHYINEHYSENITLNKISEILYIHPIYLSKLFKEKTGENFLDYVTRTRIEKSKELLKDISLKIYNVSSMVGYDSSKYFSKVFKQYVGLTPKAYREKLGV